MKTHLNKRMLTLALALMLCALPVMGLAAEYATVRGGGLNLRQTPSLDAKVLGQYWTGTWVEVLESGKDWCKVKVAGKTGYMMSKFLNQGKGGNTLYVRKNTGIGLNLRNAPSMDGAIMTSFPIDTAVTVLQKGGTWYKVQVGGLTGYMNSRYLAAGKAPSYTRPVKNPFTATLKNINGGSVVNFRLYPGMKTKVLRVVPVGTKVTVLEMGENWSKVELDGQQGYVSTYFLKY